MALLLKCRKPEVIVAYLERKRRFRRDIMLILRM
jgi:hypothetical protein